jgi:hypothetical protein
MRYKGQNYIYYDDEDLGKVFTYNSHIGTEKFGRKTRIMIYNYDANYIINLYINVM